MKNIKPINKQIDEYLNYCENVRRMSEQTLHGKRWICKELLKTVKINSLSELSNKHINDWVTEQTARNCSGRTINSRLVNLVAMLRYFQDMGMAFPKLKLRLIMKCKEQPPRRVYYTKEQIEQVLRYADHLEWLLIKLCFDCGLRISELRNLRLMNINGRMVTFIGKGSKARESYMSEEARSRLNDWIQRNRVEDFIWVRTPGKNEPMSVEDIRYLMRKPFFQAGFKNFYPHSLRHSFATDIQKNGASLMETKEMLGHARVETTERYVHSLEGRLEQIFDKYKFATSR
ncbi:MAG: tyrosine-type recombinase/integrase [Candidatus Saccharibacteria bacterium]|nr:tyrosine-type recombinase/integrase [Candidatus Saccharibacteria bacterium]